MAKNLFIFTDGGARGNPGPAAIGFVIKDASGRVVSQAGLRIGRATNNVAEYQALIAALNEAKSFKEAHDCHLEISVDSKLVAEQMKGNWRIREAHLKPLVAEAKKLEASFSKVTYRHIAREENAEADRLVNQALDR